MLKTPVAFFVFNRPDYTEKVFAKIRETKPQKLLVVADGARNEEESQKCEQVRNLILDNIDWNCEVLTNFSEENLRCKERFFTGLDWVFSQCEEAIILEDDCVPEISFFSFCEQLLIKYKNDERIMMISGHNYLNDQFKTEASYLFSRFYAIWGWATWRRAWQKADKSLESWQTFKAENQLKSYYHQEYFIAYLNMMFDKTVSEEINNWGLRWYFSCLFNDGLTIVPKVNLITNIGVEGAHSSSVSRNNYRPVFPLDTNNIKHPKLVYPNYLYDNQLFEEQFKPPQKSWLQNLRYEISKKKNELLNR